MRDEVGEILPGIDAARRVARRSVGELIAEHIARDELVDLRHRIDIENDDDGIVVRVRYADFFTGFDALQT